MSIQNTLKHLKALADETRLRLVLILWHYELSVNELVNLLNMGQSRISRHLKILTDAGLLQARRDGLWVFYKATEMSDERAFLEHIFQASHAEVTADLDMASRIIEERAVKTRNFFNSIADNWDELNKEVLGSFSLPNFVKQHVPAQTPIAVDLGCGTGEVLELLLDVSDDVIGVDGSARMLELARRRFHGNEAKLSKVSLRIGELDHLPLRDGEANFACINLVLHHLSDPQLAINEISRILAPNGILLVSDFLSHNAESMRQNYGDRWLGFSEEQIKLFIEQAGLELIESYSEPVNLGLTLNINIIRKPL